MSNAVLGLPFGALSLAFIVLWLILNLGNGRYPVRTTIIGNIFALLGLASFIVQILQWSKVI
jgi:hypothetical protein